jgi:hypothetical protein
MLTFSPRMATNSWIEAEIPRYIYWHITILITSPNPERIRSDIGISWCWMMKKYHMAWAEPVSWSHVLIVCGSRGIHRKVNYNGIRYVELCREANTIDKLETKTKLLVHEKLRVPGPINPDLRNSYRKTASLADQSTKDAADAFYEWLKYHRIVS